MSALTSTVTYKVKEGDVPSLPPLDPSLLPDAWI